MVHYYPTCLIRAQRWNVTSLNELWIILTDRWYSKHWYLHENATLRFCHLCFCHFPMWCPEFCVVLDCIGFWSLPSFLLWHDLSRDMRFPKMWYVRPAKAQTSLRIRPVWSEPLQVGWIINECSATGWTAFGVSKLKRRLHILVWVYTCQNVTLLEIACHSSFLF